MLLKINLYINKKRLTLFSITIIVSIVLSSTNITVASNGINNNISCFLDNSYSKLYCVMPSNAVVGQPIRVTIEAWDWAERICKKTFSSFISFSSTDTKAILPEPYSFKIIDSGVKTFENSVIFNTPDIHYVIARDEKNDIYAVSNPVKVTEEESEYKWYWGDIHCHSTNSDGSGTLNHNYEYARDISMLDFCAYTDHDFCWDMKSQVIWMKTIGWKKAKTAVNKFYEPGRFVTLSAYEYANSTGDGHYNVYYNTVEDAPIFTCVEKQSDRIFKLWALLKNWKNQTGYDVFTIPHHPLDSSKGWNSDFYDPELVPLIEIFQYRGSSEMKNSQGNPIQYCREEAEDSGHTVQDGLAKGYKLGLMASSDDHTGHPGHRPYIQAYLSEPRSYFGPVRFVPRWKFNNIFRWYLGLASKINFLKELLVSDSIIPEELTANGGLTGVLAKNLTRNEIFNAIKDRRCIAVTNTNRMLIDFTINGETVGNGSEVYVKNVYTQRTINVSIAGTAPIKNVTIVKNNRTFYYENEKGIDPLNLSNYKVNFSIIDDEPITGIAWNDTQNTNGRDFYYVRVIQQNGWAAWMGPIWVNPLNET